MAQKRNLEEDYTVSETGNWNVAQRFSEEKIMKPMIKCEIYEDLAKYGYDSLLEELENWRTIPSEIIRIRALYRLIGELLKLCRNAKFACKRVGTLNEILLIEKKLTAIKPNVEKTYSIKNDFVKKTRMHQIDEIKFEYVLQLVVDLKSDLNVPLNQNHLIFADKEEFDPVAFKERIKNRMINKG